MTIKDHVVIDKLEGGGTVRFEEEETPAEGYAALTEAVERELGKHDQTLFSDKFSSGDVLGTAEMNEENLKVENVNLYEWTK